jgi:zinc/manganese transport system ATP-binding protein
VTAPLVIQDAALARGGRELWSGLDLTVEPGELVAVLGPSGSGKTMMLRAILGLERLRQGGIRVLGNPVRRAGNRAIGYVPQQRPLAPDAPLRGRDLIRFGVDGHRFGPPFPRRADRERVEALIDAGGARSFADRPAGALSGGQQQRLCIARAIALEPEILLFDEPTSALDPISTSRIEDLIDELKKKYCIVIITHNLQQAARISDYAGFMFLGEL